MPPVTVRTLIDSYQRRLGLRWWAGRAGIDRALLPAGTTRSRLSLVGHLNFIHPHRVQVLGASELEYLQALGKNSFEDALGRLFSGESATVMVADGLEAPKELIRAADQSGVPLLGTSMASDRLVDHLDYYLTSLLADRLVVPGVFMDVMGIGVLLTGKSSVGKSELALELITRGHRLVADDAPEFSRVAPETLRGSCPELLHDFLEVRGLGILNVRAMFGDSAIKETKNLRLIVNLTDRAPDDMDRLEGSRRSRTLLDVEIPEICLPVAPGRNLAVLVEAAVRNHMLFYNGYDPAADFIDRQHKMLARREQ